MLTKLPATILLIFLFALKVFSQPVAVKKTDADLTALYKNMIAADYDLRYDSLAPLFKKQLLFALQDPETFTYGLDSLSEQIIASPSPDGKLKFYKWDDYTGGTAHHIISVVQYKCANGKIKVKDLEAPYEEGHYDDSNGIYAVHEYSYNKTTYYLAFGGGTYGSGHQHQTIQVFNFAGDNLLYCNNCLPDGRMVLLEYPRSEKLELKYDGAGNKIYYNEYILNDDIGFYEPTGKRVTLKLVNGVFIKQE